MAEPITKFDPSGKAAVLSYNVPEPTSYSGRNIIALDVSNPKEWFLDSAFKGPERTPPQTLRQLAAVDVAAMLRTGDLKTFPGIRNPAATHAGLFAPQSAVAGSAGGLDTATTSVLAQALRNAEVEPDLTPLTKAVAPAPAPPDGPAFESTADTPGTVPSEVTHLARAVGGSILSRPTLADHRVRPQITDLDIAHITEMLHSGKRLSVHRTMWGEYTHSFLSDPFGALASDGQMPEGKPQISLVETYRLSTFLGQYGAGRTLKTFTLLPGEKTTISIKTFRRSETTSKSASSVLDSFTKESADDFENTVQHENSDKQAQQKSLEWHVEAEASGSWGFASAKVSGGVKGTSASQREQFAKNVSSAVNKHASKASAKRDVQVNTSHEVKEQSGEETSIIRQLENINVGRTLNFVFRQMNQEYITILHLVDVRVAFWNGYGESVHEVPLSGLNDLLDAYVKADKKSSMRQMILDQLSAIFDYEDKLVEPPMVETRQVGAGGSTDNYLRWRKRTSTYRDETGNEITVPGVIVNVDKAVMRTEGVVVDALLGQGEALDTYSAALQTQAARERALDNDREALGQKLVNDNEIQRAKIFKDLFPNSVALPGKISVSASDSGVTVSSTSTAPAGPGRAITDGHTSSS
ncbi:hypothetical protein [Streptomyces sp. bgisy034]|uniref:hypothetical protein n=1 Tax=Streptomyces sp. bgisy034 TaxID=3413774 RepID=UPI003EBD2515